MGRRAKELGPLAVSRLNEPGLYAVGGVAGLYLQVIKDRETGKATGAKTWILRTMINGKRRDRGLGAYPGVGVARAREKAQDARDLIKSGVDPHEQAKAARSALKAASAADVTFKQCAEKYIKSHRLSWKSDKHADQWANTLETYAYPFIGSLLVRDVAVSHVLEVLEQRDKSDLPTLWESKTETASRLRGRIEAVLDWAAARSYRAGENPARWKGHLDKLLPARSKIAKVVHHAALPVSQIGAFMAELRKLEGNGARCLEFAVLTAARSGEARGALWSEVDMDAGVWTIPCDRMKAEKEHRVPLSDAAISLLKAQERKSSNDLIFPAPRGGPLSDMTLTAVLRRMEVEATAHGFRSSFRDWCSERTNYPREVAEQALAHSIGSAVEAAYRRGDLFEKRSRLMQEWANFCAIVETKGAVVPMRAAAN
jgi:integrase